MKPAPRLICTSTRCLHAMEGKPVCPRRTVGDVVVFSCGLAEDIGTTLDRAREARNAAPGMRSGWFRVSAPDTFNVFPALVLHERELTAGIVTHRHEWCGEIYLSWGYWRGGWRFYTIEEKE